VLHKVLLTYAAGGRVAPVVVSTPTAVATSALFNTLALSVILNTHTHTRWFDPPSPHILFNIIPPFPSQTGEGTAMKRSGVKVHSIIPRGIIGAEFL